MVWCEKVMRLPKVARLRGLVVAGALAVWCCGPVSLLVAQQPADEAPVAAPSQGEAGTSAPDPAAPAKPAENHAAPGHAAESGHAAEPGHAANDGHSDGHGAHGHADFTHDNLSEEMVNPAHIRTDLAIWTFFVFVAVLAVLGKFAWGPIVAGLEKREQRIIDNIEAAERQNRQAAELLKAYELKLQAAANEVREMLDEARRDAQHTQEEIIAKARAEAEAERLRALRDIERATEQSLKRVAEQSVNLAIDLAGKIMHAQLKPEDHNMLIQEAVGQFVQSKPTAN